MVDYQAGDFFYWASWYVGGKDTGNSKYYVSRHLA